MALLDLAYEKLKEIFLEGKKNTFWIAYSGGIDSQVLLHLCARIRSILPINLNAIHINHTISPNSEHWENFCKQTCDSLKINFISRRVLVPTDKTNLEENARELRYEAIFKVMTSGDVLLTAHHLDDQAETFLLQLFRGAGLKGLSAMPFMKTTQEYFHARPLLNTSRKEIECYATENKLTWIEDEMNKEVKLSRNYIRHEIVPILKRKYPSISKTITRSAEHIAKAQDLLEELSADLYANVRNKENNTLSVSALRQLSAIKQQFLLRHWIHQSGYVLPNEKKLITILQTVLTADRDKNPVVTWKQTEIRRYQDNLYLLKTNTEQVTKQILHWEFEKEMMIPGVGKFLARLEKGKGFKNSIKHIAIKFREGGEKLNVNGMHRPLKKFLQEKNVLPWLRPYLPLGYIDDRLVFIPNYYLDKNYVAEKDDEGWVIDWIK